MAQLYDPSSIGKALLMAAMLADPPIHEANKAATALHALLPRLFLKMKKPRKKPTPSVKEQQKKIARSLMPRPESFLKSHLNSMIKIIL